MNPLKVNGVDYAGAVMTVLFIAAMIMFNYVHVI